MKKVTALILLLSCSLLLTGCATGYRSSGFFNNTGYKSKKINATVYQVTYKGNGLTSSQKVYRFAMKRAAQLALQNGYPYFTVLSSKNYESGQLSAVGVVPMEVDFPISILKVKFHKQKVAKAYTAKKVFTNN